MEPTKRGAYRNPNALLRSQTTLAHELLSACKYRSCIIACFHSFQSTTQYRNDETMISTARGQTVSVENFVNTFFGGEYKYSNRW